MEWQLHYPAASAPYLRLDEHGHVHEHVVQLLDAVLQLDDVIVTRLDVLQRLLGLTRVRQDLTGNETSKTNTRKTNNISSLLL